jgi:dihydropteroate synthase
MGVVNVTPDSFSDGGRYFDPEAAIQRGRQLALEGADILDIGGESTRPGAEPASAEEELRRALPVVESLARAGRTRIAVDTYKPEVAEACLAAGATIINDITALRDPRMAEVARRHGAGVVLMHMKGTPQTMREQAEYVDVVAQVREFLAERVRQARAAGIAEIYVDPGIGFAKTAAHSFTLLKRLGELRALGCPILVGPSRKSFLAGLEGMERVEERLEGTLAAVAVAVVHGADVVRVHDVAACRKAILVAEAVRNVAWTESN